MFAFPAQNARNVILMCFACKRNWVVLVCKRIIMLQLVMARTTHLLKHTKQIKKNIRELFSEYTFICKLQYGFSLTHMCLCLQTENYFVVVTKNETAKRSSEEDHFVKSWLGKPSLQELCIWV